MCKARVFDKTRDDKNARLSLSSVPVSVLATVRFSPNLDVSSGTVHSPVMSERDGRNTEVVHLGIRISVAFLCYIRM